MLIIVSLDCTSCHLTDLCHALMSMSSYTLVIMYTDTECDRTRTNHSKLYASVNKQWGKCSLVVNDKYKLNLCSYNERKGRIKTTDIIFILCQKDELFSA